MSRIWLNSNTLASYSKSAFSSPHPPARSQPAFRRCQPPKPGPTASRGQPGAPPAPRPGSGRRASLAVPYSAPTQPSAFINARQTRKRHLTALKLFRFFSVCFGLFRRVLHRKTSVVMAEATRRRAGEGRSRGPPAPRVHPWGQPCGAAVSEPAGTGVRAPSRGSRGKGVPSADLRTYGEEGSGRSAGMGAALTALPALILPLLPASEAERLCVSVPAVQSAARPQGHSTGLRPRSRGVVGVNFHSRGCKVRLGAAAAVSQQAAGSCTPSERGLSGSYWASSVD